TGDPGRPLVRRTGMDAAIILRRRAGRFVAVALTATAGLALLPGTPSGAATTDATISNFAFAPNPLDAPVGATVKWTNDDGTSHTVTADDGSFDSGPIGAGGTFTRTFGQVRTIAYHCNIHPGMHGTLQIGGGATTTTTAAPTTTTTAGPTTTTTADPVTTTAPPPASPATTAPAPTATTAPRSTTTKPVPAAPASRPSAPAPEPAAVAAVTPATSSAAAPASGPGATTAAGGESTAAPAATGPTPPSPDLSTD